MKKRIKRIAPVQLGKLLATMYALLSVLIVPFMLIAVLFSGTGKIAGLLMVIAIPIAYIVIGFIGGIIGAFVYNLCAGWVGGLDIEFEE